MLLQNFEPMNDDKIGHMTILLLSDWLKILELHYATPKKFYKIGSWTSANGLCYNQATIVGMIVIQLS